MNRVPRKFTTWRHTSSTCRLQPINIAFFGSDDFSVHCLRDLHRLCSPLSGLIDSIHVITRSVKARGRLSKKWSDLPIAHYCSAHSDIKLHRADSAAEIKQVFAGDTFHLAVAVSFGMLIPNEVIRACPFGGLNVHPSLLPRHSGASPIQYALLNDDPYTGCTVQTLHPTKFDKGEILAQSDPIPIGDSDDYKTLELRLAKSGGEMLTSIVSRIHDSSLVALKPKYPFSLAPKISPSMREISWSTMNARRIKRLNDALGPLFTHVRRRSGVESEILRVILDGIKVHPHPEKCPLNAGNYINTAGGLLVQTTDGCITVDKIKLQYCGFLTPTSFCQRMLGNHGKYDVCTFIDRSIA